MRPTTSTLTPQELEIMKIIWDRGEVTVRDVYEALREQRRIAYTTVMTMMRILAEKGHLKRRTENRAHLFRPARPKSAVLASMVREFLDRVFNGSAQPLLVHLLKDRRLSDHDREEIARLIKEQQ
jgi:BlaI family transcriptional regulator, penicillinase repressor